MNYISMDVPISVMAAGDHLILQVLKAKGCGTVLLEGGVKLSRVLHVPALQLNLFSLAMAQISKIKLEMCDGKLTLSKTDFHFTTTHQKNGVFLLKVRDQPASASSCSRPASSSSGSRPGSASSCSRQGSSSSCSRPASSSGGNSPGSAGSGSRQGSAGSGSSA